MGFPGLSGPARLAGISRDFVGIPPTVGHGVFEGKSSFRVAFRTAVGFNCCISGLFCYYWLNVHFGGGGGASHWALILWGLDTFLIFPNFIIPKS